MPIQPNPYPSLQQNINGIAAMFYRCGGRHAVICPGSRNVPLIAAFVNHPEINCLSVADERSAGFIGLGIAQQTKKPVAILCTSGTAALNFYPAICEAFYQNIPLIAITADRPPELIDQWDGQSIRQKGIYKEHILEELTITDQLNSKNIHETEFELKNIISAAAQQNLPVHINVPLREPFYPAASETYTYHQESLTIETGVLLPVHATEKDIVDIPAVLKLISRSEKTLVVIGANAMHAAVLDAVHEAKEKTGFTLIADVCSNYPYDDAVTQYDLFLGRKNELPELQPEVLITSGGPILSKNLKLYLRKLKPKLHLHIQSLGHVGDPFVSLTKIVRADPELFFRQLSQISLNNKAYENLWRKSEGRFPKKELIDFIEQQEFCELKAAKLVLKSLPAQTHLQVANSMPVRYVQLFGTQPTVTINANRGTSGIDGCSSTAVGAAISGGALTVLLTGDIAFFYDINAFWHSNVPSNLRIILLNNRGGGIFSLIDGADQVTGINKFLETPHQRTAKHIAADLGLEYFCAEHETELNEGLIHFFDKKDKAAILEIKTDPTRNITVYRKMKELASEKLRTKS